MTFTQVLLLMFSAILVENFIFSKFYGCCPFLGVSDKPATALGMGMAVTFVMTLSSAVTWIVYYLVLVPLKLEYLKTVSFILVIAALVQFIEMFLRRFAWNLPAPDHHQLRGARLRSGKYSERVQLCSLRLLRTCGGAGLCPCHRSLCGGACENGIFRSAQSLQGISADSRGGGTSRHGVLGLLGNELLMGGKI